MEDVASCKTLDNTVDGQPFTEHCSHYDSFNTRRNEFNFSNRFDAEEIEWFLNKPFGLVGKTTAVHNEILGKRQVDTGKLTQLLRLGGSPNAKDMDGQTALHHSLRLQNSEEILFLLLNHGGDLYIKDNKGRTPLSILQSLDSPLYHKIIQEHLCATFTIDDLQTIENLHCLVQQHGPLDDFKELYCQLPHDKPRYTDLSNNTLLFRACKEGWIDGVSLLLSQTDEIPLTNTTTNETPLHAACEGNHYDIVVKLINKFPELLLMKDKLPYRGWYPIHTACAFGASDKLLEIILLGLSFITKEMSNKNTPNIQFIDAMGRSPLYIATKCGNISHIDMMTDSLRFGELQQSVPSMYAITSDNISQISVIHCAIVHKDIELVQNLLSKFPISVETSAYPSVFLLSQMLLRLSEVVDDFDKAAVSLPLNVTLCENSDGEISIITTSASFEKYRLLCNIEMSPLAMAAAIGSVEIAEILLSASARDGDGLAIRIALYLQYCEVARVLLTVGNDPTVCSAECKNLFTLPGIVLHSFTEVNLQQNNLSELPLELFQIPELKVLNVSYNNITRLPVGEATIRNTWNCERLEILDISYNKLNNLPSVIWKMPKLKCLFAHYNAIDTLEKMAEYCTELDKINISNNELEQALRCVFNAKVVNVSHNKLKSLPKKIWNLEILENLNASNNQIKEICFPNSTCSPKVDKKISFTSKGHRAIKAEGNTTFRRYISSGGYSKGMTVLNLSNNNLTSIPKEISCFAHYLYNLDISGNHIATLYISSLPPCLKYLSAKGCSIESIEINDPGNSFPCIHRNHASLENLTYLLLQDNCLCNIAFENSNFSAEKNDLKFPALKTLDLSNNRLNELDSSIGKQKSLRTLSLNGNVELKCLPLELSYLSDTLNSIVLNNLPNLSDPPKEYHTSPNKLMSFMKSRIKSSVSYRMINLMIVGGNRNGKTSLMRRLCKDGTKAPATVDEICICNWEFLSDPSAAAVNFKIWDFPSQDHSHTLNYCFYAKQAVYLVVFNLMDGDFGIAELYSFLRNIKVHAPECPVIIVGTHRDLVSNLKEEYIDQDVRQKYSDTSYYPTITNVCCISNTDGSIKTLRKKIYTTAAHLYIDGKQKLTLKFDKPVDDPDALMQQKIPKSYLHLQKEIHDKALEMKQNQVAPIMNKDEFCKSFFLLLQDEEELASAVEFLHCQRGLLHFKDPAVEMYYFLDIQWIFNMMVNTTRIPRSNDGTILKDDLIAQSVLPIPIHLQSGLLALFAQFHFAIPLDDKYVFVYSLLPEELQLPEKQTIFNEPKTTHNDDNLFKKKLHRGLNALKKRAAFTATKHKGDPQIKNVLLYKNSSSVDDGDETTTDITDGVDHTDSQPVFDEKEMIQNGERSPNDAYLETLNYPSDQSRTASNLSMLLPGLRESKIFQSFPQLNIVDSLSFENSTDLSSPNKLQSYNQSWLKAANLDPVLHPPLYRFWPATFIPDGFWPQLFTRIISDNGITTALSTLLHTALQNREYDLSHASTAAPSLWKLYQKACKIEYDEIELLELKQVTNTKRNTKTINLSEQYENQIEFKMSIRNMALVHKNYGKNSSYGLKAVLKLATRILILIEQHILDIGSEWFPGTIRSSRSKEILSYVPCPLCLTEDSSVSSFDDATCRIMCCDGCQVVCFSLKELLTAYAQPSMSINCPVHNEMLVQQLAPDMCFEDLDEDIVCGPDIPLTIDKDKVLGSGGSALVLRGEIKSNDMRQLVAVKIIREESKRIKQLTDFFRSYTTSVENYRVIRKEVLFLSTLHHDNLTQLCGVCTNPFMLLMELAPLGSLGSILKQYRAANSVLTPVVLQASMCQIASALAFLHERHVVYLDLKSDNVLAWKFPTASHSKADNDVLLKITDYGISRISSVASEIRSESISGTPGFIAPEVYTGRHQVLQSNKIDVFSFGMFLYELVALLKPFEFQSDQTEEMIRRMQRPQIPESAKENFTLCLAHKIMKCCWRQDPRERPTMAKVLEWSKLPELCCLRTIHSLNPSELLCTCQCQVTRNHVHEYVNSRPSNIQCTIKKCEQFPPLFSLITSQTPPTNRRRDKVNHHTQVWIAQYSDEATSKLTIITFRSSDLGYRIHEDSTPKVLAMANVANYMWVYTVDHKIYIVHTAKMQVICCVDLENSSLRVVQLLHVPEWHTVLVLWELSEVWCLYDEVDISGIHVIGTLQLNRHNPISMLCKVDIQQMTEVWATREDKEIVVLTQSPTGCSENKVLECSIMIVADKSKNFNCNLIKSFNIGTQKSATHVWASFEGRSQLVCWEPESKAQLHSVSLHCEGENGEVTALLGHKKCLYIGTSLGTVEVFDSESGCFLQQFMWHGNKVQSLLELPPEIKKSICAEYSSEKYKSVSHSELVKEFVPRKRRSQESFLQRRSFSAQKLTFSTDFPLIATLGVNMANSLNFSNQSSTSNPMFLTWTGLPSS